MWFEIVVLKSAFSHNILEAIHVLAENGELLTNDDRIGKDFILGSKIVYIYLTSNYYIIL